MIENVEELGTELHPRLFSHSEVLESGEVDSLDSGTIKCVSSRVAHQCATRDRCWRRETGRIEGEQLPRGIPRHPRRGIAAGDKIGEIHGKVAIKSGGERVSPSTNCDCVGRAASESDYSAELPATQHLLRNSRLGAGYIPNESA